MYEYWTPGSLAVLKYAEEEAKLIHHNYIGTEMILLGLLAGEVKGVAATVLAEMGVKLTDVRAEVLKVIGLGAYAHVAEFPLTPAAKHITELAWDETRQLGTNYIGTEHLLLAIVREPCVASRVLEALGVDLAKVRSCVIKAIFKLMEEKSWLLYY